MAAPKSYPIEIGTYSDEYKEEITRVVNGVYDVPGFFPGTVRVLDVGANIGSFLVFAHTRKSNHWPVVHYLGYESNPALVPMGQKNLSQMTNTTYKLVPVAVVANAKIGDDRTVLVKRNPTNPLKDTVVYDDGVDQTDIERVPAVEVKTLGDCDVLKISSRNLEFPLLLEYLTSRKEDCKPRYVLYRYTSEKSRNYALIYTEKDYTLFDVVKLGAGEGILKLVSKSANPDVYRTVHDKEGYDPERDALFERGAKGIDLPRFQ